MICYHGTPVSGSQIDAARFLTGRHSLISFANPQNITIAADTCASFILDNGAFSFWRGGQSPDWDEYYRWVNEWAQHPGYDWHLIPDIIDGTEDDNWRLMFQYANSAPYGVPVYHMHESIRHLERLIRNYPRIAIGSSGQWPNPGTSSWWSRMAEIMNVVCDPYGRPKSKVHGLRMLDPLIFGKLPLSSADSCNASINAGSLSRFGMYTPPTPAQRAEVIATRIEHANSAAVWVRTGQYTLF